MILVLKLEFPPGPADLFNIQFCDQSHETHTTAYTAIYKYSALSKRKRNISACQGKNLDEKMFFSKSRLGGSQITAWCPWIPIVIPKGTLYEPNTD